jgi:hypothetical protein
MKKSVVVFILTLLTLAACQSPITKSGGKGSLDISFSLGASRTILPDYVGQTDALQVSLSGPEGYNATQNLGARENARFVGLTLGTYTATVKAHNYDGQIFLTGTKVFDVQEGNNTETISLDSTMNGSGSLQVDISFPIEAGIDEIQYRTYLLDSTPGSFQNLADLDGSISINQDLPSGYYFFEIQFLKEASILAGIYEVAWVFDNTLSQKSYSLPLGFDVPEPPRDFMAAESGNDVILSWVDASITETGFRLERQIDGGVWSLLSTLPSGTESYTDGSTDPDTSYSYRLRAVGASADSPWVSYRITTGNRQGSEGELNINIIVTDPEDLQNIFDTIGDLGEAEVTLTSAVQGASSWAWHLDGNQVSTSSSYSFDSNDLSNGLHILALIVEVEGQFFSESITFSVSKEVSLNILSLTVDGEEILPEGSSFAYTITDDRSTVSISALTEDPSVSVALEDELLPGNLADLPANGGNQSYTLIVSGAPGQKIYNLSISRDYTIDETIDIYYYKASGGAPTIWFWEDQGIALASELGETWPGPLMSPVEDDYWHIAIPLSLFTPGLPHSLEVIFDGEDSFSIFSSG